MRVSNFRVPYGELIIKKRGNKWIVDPIDDEPLTRYELNRLLMYSHRSGGFQIRIEEVAMMYEEFRRNPNFTEAHFGIDGYFLFAKP